MCSFLAPGDYNGTTITVTFPDDGTTLVHIPIPIVNDELHEDIEFFNLSLSTLDGSVQLGPDSEVEIVDNDRKFTAHMCNGLQIQRVF